MGSRERDQTVQHQQPHISSLVVRPSSSDGGDGGRGEGGRVVGGSEYEPGEVRRDPLPYSRSDRYKGELGYRTRAGSISPARRTDGDHRYNSDLDHSGGPPRGREFGSRREASGRHRDFSPPYARGRAGAHPLARGLDGDGHWRGPFRGDGMGRNNNPNVRPREGDWYCADPLCRNLNFARREYCNNCKRHRYAPIGSPPPRPRRGFPASPPPPPLPPPRRIPGPPLDLSPGRSLNGYRSPPRGWARDDPRDFALPPPPRHDPIWRDRERVRLHYPDDDFHGRRPPVDWVPADRGRGPIPTPSFERRLPLSPPPPPSLPPPRGGPGRWGRDIRERSRSPMRGSGAPPPLKDYRRDSYAETRRDERRGGPGRGRIGGAY